MGFPLLSEAGSSLLQEDLLSLALIVLGISVLSAVLGIWKAMRVEPNEVVS